MDRLDCHRGSVSVKVNDEMGHFFQTRKVLWQGDPLLLVLFNLIVDMLAVLIEMSMKHDQFNGVVPHLVEGGFSIL